MTLGAKSSRMQWYPGSWYHGGPGSDQRQHIPTVSEGPEDSFIQTGLDAAGEFWTGFEGLRHPNSVCYCAFMTMY